MKQYLISDIIKIREEKKTFDKKVQDMTTPCRSELSLQEIQTLYKPYSERFNLSEVDEKGFFILVVAAMFIPKVFLSGNMTNGLRKRLSVLLGIKVGTVTKLLRNYINYYKLYKSVANIVDYIYNDITATIDPAPS